MWREEKPKLNRYVTILVNAKLDEVITRSELLEDKLVCSLEKMEENGINITDIDDMVTQYSNNVYNAREKFGKAKMLLVESDDQSVNLARLNINEAKQDLVNAQEVLKQIVKSIKAQGGTIEDCEADTYVVNECAENSCQW